MNPGVTAADIDRFRGVIARCMGLQFEEAKAAFLADVLNRRARACHQSLDTYLAGLERSCTSQEFSLLAQELTVGETYFFRNSDQFRAFEQIVLPERVGAQTSTGRQIRLLSAGSASGDEAYTLAILVREAGLDRSWTVSILGVDINPAMVRKATTGRFSTWALRETRPEVQQRWFRSDGRDVVLDESVRTMVRFEEGNLAKDEARLWPAETYDVVFCRNVLMYFEPEVARSVVSRIWRALKPGGYLFLGHAETLRGLSNDFHLCHTHDAFYYQRKESTEPAAMVWPALPRVHDSAPVMLAALDDGEAWITAIQRASDRIQTLSTSPHTVSSSRTVPRVRDAKPPARQPAWDLGAALDLLRQERFAEALETMRSLPPESKRDPDVLLVFAALLTYRGHLEQAEDACRQLIEIDELNAGAHYLLALCREGASDPSNAVDHDQIAIYLDPTFAMPHLHLGVLTRRTGDRVGAQRELAQALLLLQREDSSRILLFGGGFGRETLMELCRAEITGCGGQVGR